MALPHQSVAKVLVLGVGGGSVIRLLAQHASCERIVGVEFQPHLQDWAIRHMGLGDVGMEWVVGDAAQFVTNADAASFDFIIDDAFSQDAGEAVRAFRADRIWLDKLARLLRPGGQLVLNFADNPSMMQAARASQGIGAQSRVVFRCEGCENRVLAMSWLQWTPQELRRRLQAFPLLDPQRSQGARYAARRWRERRT